MPRTLLIKRTPPEFLNSFALLVKAFKDDYPVTWVNSDGEIAHHHRALPLLSTSRLLNVYLFRISSHTFI